MRRRSLEMSGCVNFPVSDPLWNNSGEGGMVVKLVVVNNTDFDAPDNFEVCCGAHVFDVYSEPLIGDDARKRPEVLGEYDSAESVMAEQLAFREWEAYHYPHLHDEPFSRGNELSRPYLAVVVLGSTGWSGWSDELGRSWSCTYQDLSDDGKRLYEMMRSLYPGCALHLLTFIDT